MTDVAICLFFNTRKSDAIKIALNKQGKDFDKELIAIIEKLYNDIVPKKEREMVEEKIRKDHESEIEAERYVAAHCHDKNDDYYFIVKGYENLYSFAKRYKDEVQKYVGKCHLDKLAIMFGEQTRIDNFDFGSLAGIFLLQQNSRITAIVDFNFENERFSFLDHNTDSWRDFTLRDMVNALDEAEKVKGLTNSRDRIFLIPCLRRKRYHMMRWIILTKRKIHQ